MGSNSHYFNHLFKMLFVYALSTVLTSGCMNLDPFLFKGEELDRYNLDNFTETAECSDALDTLEPVHAGMIHEVTLKSGGNEIAAVLIAKQFPLAATDTMILYLHGTSKHIDYYWPRTCLIAATGYPVMVIDYRGYGTSSGEPTEKGIYEDGRAAQKYIREKCGNPYLVVYAYSLGSLVGCEICSSDTSGTIVSLILEAPISSIETLIQDASYLTLPGSFITSYKGENREKIKLITIPLLWLHGTSDMTLPYKHHGSMIYANYHGKQGYYCLVEGAGHRTVPSTIGYHRYIEGITDFITGNASDNPLFRTVLE